MVKQLASSIHMLNYEFSIFCGNKDLDGTVLVGVAFDEWVPYNENARVWYSSSNDILHVLKAAIKNERPDHLFITGLYDFNYNLKPLLFSKGVKKIVSVRGMLHPGALSQKSLKKKIYLGLWKLLGLHKQIVFHATDAAEKKYIEDVFGPSSAKAAEGKSRVRIVVAANFPNLLPVQPVKEKKPGQLKLASIALISPMKNILMVLETLSNWQLAVGSGQLAGSSNKEIDISSIEYNIYGPVKDKKYWEACELLIQKLPSNITARYHGDIAPGVVTAALADSHVFILPSKSENFGHSLYEALSAGRPVITSNNTPWVNLKSIKAGINISLEGTKELQQAIGFFAAMGHNELEEWNKGAKSYAEAAIDMESIRGQYEEMFGEV